MNQLVGVQLKTPFFSCILWLPFCQSGQNPSDAMNRMVHDVVEAIRRVSPEFANEMQVSDMIYWPPPEGDAKTYAPSSPPRKT